MKREVVTTTLQFVGDWPWWAGCTAALLLACLSWFLYRPDVRKSGRVLSWLLPTLRALAVAMIVLMLSGPVLRHRKVIGQLSRVLLFVDSSRSMGLTDTSMDLGRKMRILQSLGMLPENAVKMDLPKAGEALGDAQVLAQRASAAQGVTGEEWTRLLGDFEERIEAAGGALQAGGAGARTDDFRREMVEPAKEIAHREMHLIDDRQRAARDLGKLAEVAARWQNEAADQFRRNMAESAGVSGSPVSAALQRFDTMSRWQRLQASLLEGEKGRLLQKLAEKHDVQLYALQGGTAKKLWESSAVAAKTLPGLGKPIGETTDLAKPIEAVLGNDRGGEEHPAVVLFSDGQQNEGESPIEAGRVLGGRQLPVYTVGFGGTSRPHDLAVMKFQAPEAVFATDHLRGQVTVKDDMPPGMSFTVTIKDGERTLWEQKLATQGAGLRPVPFDFAIDQSVQDRLKEKHSGVEVAGVPIEMQVSVTALPGDVEPGNNSVSARVRALTQKRKILLVDVRARWEARYLRNLFQRDEQWEINAVLPDPAGNAPGFVRGHEPEQFPDDLSTLQTYDLIMLGEVPAAQWHPGELEAIRDFVEKRGGALVLIDGERGWFKEYADTPLGPLFPVEWKGAAVREHLGHLELSQRGQSLAPFALVPDRQQNAEAWHGLPAPHWLSGATALPGAETFIAAEAPGQPGDRLPVAVLRPFGAGRVFYHAIEDSWRWRYEVADQYHTKYWNQVADWIAELPFAVHDRLVSLDAGGITYRPGESAELRVRLRDGQGHPVTNTVADAILYRDGIRAAAIRLTPDDNAGGLFHGRTAELEPGNYEVAVESAAIAASDSLARTSFKVEPRESGELSQLTLNEELLRQMSSVSGGEYLREEYTQKLVDLLAPLSHGQVSEVETVLWQSYWWFVPLIFFLTLEWFLRKRAGML